MIGLAAISLQPSFAQEHMLLSLHVWMMLVRLRAEGSDGKTSAQLMYEEFTEDVEARLRGTGVKVCLCLSHGSRCMCDCCRFPLTVAQHGLCAQVRIGKHLAELEKMFYGSSMAYDKVCEIDVSAIYLLQYVCSSSQRS